MKTTFRISLVLLLLVPVILSSCDAITGNESQPSVPAYTPGVTPEVPSFTDEELTSLGLDETQINQYSERGVLSVDTPELASTLAGFHVSPPAYLPEGLTRGAYSVKLSGAGLPEEVKPKFNNTTVTVIYSPPGETKLLLALIYMLKKTDIPGGEPIQVGDYQGMKLYTPAADNQNPSLALGWGEETRYFNIVATLGGPLDEETVMKIAASIPIQ